MLLTPRYVRWAWFNASPRESVLTVFSPIQGQTALHWAAVRGALPASELLLRSGARLDAQVRFSDATDVETPVSAGTRASELATAVRTGFAWVHAVPRGCSVWSYSVHLSLQGAVQKRPRRLFI